MRKTNLFLYLLLGLSLTLTGCQGNDRIVTKSEVSSGESLVEDGVVDTVKSIVENDISSDFAVMETVVEVFESNVNASSSTSFPSNNFTLEFTDDYKSLINNSCGDLLFVNESEFSNDLSKLLRAYSNTSLKTGIVSISENDSLIESFYFGPSNFISVIVDDSVLKSSYDIDESSWICKSGLSGFDSVEELEYSMQYDSGFDFLLSSDRCIFKLVNVELLDSGDTVYICEYLYIGGESGVMKFTISSDDYIKEISKEFKNRSKFYSLVFEESNENFKSSLLNFGDLLCTINNAIAEEVYNDIILNENSLVDN